MPRKTAKKPQPPKLPKGEAEQVRIRRELGHDFALKPDAFGRHRLTPGTAEARRVYEVSNGGYTSTGGIVRLRNVDPLKGITSLTRQQREAGQRFRDDFERAQREGRSVDLSGEEPAGAPETGRGRRDRRRDPLPSGL